MEGILKKTIILVFGTAFLGFISCNEKIPEPVVEAETVIYKSILNEDKTYTITNERFGRALFKQFDDGSVEVELSTEKEMNHPFHAVHIHDGSCEEPAGHWNQGKDDKFCRHLFDNVTWGRPRAGDIGNLEKQNSGKGYFSIKTDLWSLTEDNEKNIIGKVIYIHQYGEDFAMECFENHTHVHNNPKIACGIIELKDID